MSEAMRWMPHHEFGDRVIAIADTDKPCHFCGEPTPMRVHTRPAHGGCWDAAGRPTPTAASAPPPNPAPPAVSGVSGQPEGRRRPEPQRTFQPDEAEEFRDFRDALKRLDITAPDEVVTAALSEWHQAVAVEGDPVRFVSNPGRTGIVAFEWLTERYGAMVMPAKLESERTWEITQSQRVLRVLAWSDPDAPLELGQHVTETDVHAQYLAAAHSVQCGDGEPDELGPDELAGIDQVALTKAPGYVRLKSVPELSGCPPHVRGAFAPATEGWWLPTPLAAYLIRDHQITLDLDAAVVWHHERLVNGKRQRPYGPRLSRWAKLFVPAREQLMLREHDGNQAAALAVKLVKATYSTFLGGLLRSVEHNDKHTLRPDWADQVMAQASANMLRHLDKVWTAGGRALGGMKDAVWWTGPAAPTVPEGLQITDHASERPYQPGKWHVTRHAVVDEAMVRAHEAGNPTFLRKAIIHANKARLASEE